MPKVILIEKPKANIDTSKAKDFGEIEYLFDNAQKRCSAFDTIKYQRYMLKKLEEINFDPDSDFICATGSVLVLTVCLIAIAQRYDRFKALIFSSTESQYVERIFDVNYVN